MEGIKSFIACIFPESNASGWVYHQNLTNCELEVLQVSFPGKLAVKRSSTQHVHSVLPGEHHP